MERTTRQREAIRTAFDDADRPLSPQEVVDLAQRDVPNLGIATVYRTVKQGVEEGWLTPVELPGEPARYEVAGKDHHHHFRCRKCDGVFEVEGCPGNMRSLVPRGFRLEKHEVVLYGLCDSCNKS